MIRTVRNISSNDQEKFNLLQEKFNSCEQFPGAFVTGVLEYEGGGIFRPFLIPETWDFFLVDEDNYRLVFYKVKIS